MDIFKKFEQECKKFLPEKPHLERPPKGVKADLAFPCFEPAKKEKKNPAEIAKNIARKKIPPNSLVGKIEAAGPYVNFSLNWELFSNKVVRNALQQDYGKGSQKGKIELEHTSMNPTGPVHVGRLRNSVIGDTLGRILKFTGKKVDIHYFVNDIGKQIAIILWGKENKIQPDKNLIKLYQKYASKPDFETMFLYVAANQALENKNIVNEMLKKPKELRKIAEKCLKGQIEVLKRIGISFDSFDFESTYEISQDVQKVIDKLEEKKALKQEEGMTGIDLSPFGLKRRKAIVPLIRSDGTSVYTLRDLAYHLDIAKKTDYKINVLGEDHKVEFRELKTILEKLLDCKMQLEVVHYAFVNFKGIELSTRKGKTAPLDILLDEGMDKARKKTKHEETAKKVAKAAIRYHIIKTALNNQINFSWDQALSFEGNTGPYIQYTYARICSIIEKSRKKKDLKNISSLSEEKDLIKQVSFFPGIVKRASKTRKPNLLANYTYELASIFNEYYHSHKVIGSEKEAEKIALLMSIKNVLGKCMWVLGIDAMESM